MKKVETTTARDPATTGRAGEGAGHPAEPVVWQPGPFRRRVHGALVAARAAIGARRRRARQDFEPEALAGERLLRGLQAMPAGIVRECRLVEVPSDRPPFLDSGIVLDQGDWISTFAWGRTWLSETFDVWLGAHFQLWARIGDGPVFRGVRATNTFQADRAGELGLGTCFPATWADRTGRLATTPRDFARAHGTFSVIVVRWAPRADRRAVLAELAAAEPAGLAAAELDRMGRQVMPPSDWEYKWQLSDAEIFSDCPEPGAGDEIRCHTHEDVAAVERRIDLPLTATTRLRWRWRFDELPSSLPEDSAVTHDYMSIAVEFDNGQDITYYWSSSLPPGYSYPCPLRHWNEVETHIVLRSGTAQLGKWLSEDRGVREDYRRAVGPPPRRIVAVWLIGVSIFQRGTGSCRYADIELVDQDRVVAI